MGPASPRPAGQHQADRGGEAHDDYNDNDNNDDGTDEAGEPRSEHGEGLLILDLRHHYLYPEQADRITALLGADTRGVHGSLGGDLGAPLHRPQPATHRPPAPAQACDVLYICIHSNVWRRTCTFKCGGGEAHHQPEEIRPVLAVRVSQWDP